MTHGTDKRILNASVGFNNHELDKVAIAALIDCLESIHCEFSSGSVVSQPSITEKGMCANGNAGKDPK